MDDRLRDFLEKFAELERRVRRMAAEDRARRQEAQRYEERLARAEKESERLARLLEMERRARIEARERVDGLIARLTRLQETGEAGAEAGDESGA